MKFKKYLLLLLTLTICSSNSWGSNYPPKQWTLVHQQDGISVYSRNTEQSDIKEIRASFTVKSTMPKVLNLLANVDEYKQWVYKCSFAETVKTVSENEMYYYTISDFPFPFEDRDLVIHSKHWIDNKTGAYHSSAEAATAIIEKKEGLVRIPSFSSSWTVTPLNDQLIQVEYQVTSSAGGLIPDWLVNLAVAKGPLETMIAFKAIVAER